MFSFLWVVRFVEILNVGKCPLFTGSSYITLDFHTKGELSLFLVNYFFSS